MATAADHHYHQTSRRGLQAEARDILERLGDAHEKVLEAMSVLAALTQKVDPDREAYTKARWRLSKASRIRRTVWDEALALLSNRADAAETGILADLQKSNYELRECSGKHVSEWTSERIGLDWIGYCEASRTIRWKMMSVLRHERRHVFPMLERVGGI
jgi:hypothetical protein